MTRLVKLAAHVCLVVFLTRCSQWSKPNATYNELSSDRATCNTTAMQNFPPDFSPVSQMDHDRLNAPPGFVPPGSTQTDFNASARAKAYAECMISLGWTQGN